MDVYITCVTYNEDDNSYEFLAHDISDKQYKFLIPKQLVANIVGSMLGEFIVEDTGGTLVWA